MSIALVVNVWAPDFGSAQSLADPAPLALPEALKARWDGYLIRLGGPDAEVTADLLEGRWRGYVAAIAAYGVRVESCAAGSPQPGETAWASEVVARFGAERVTELRSPIAAWVVVAHLTSESLCHGELVGAVVLAEARYRRLLLEVGRRYLGFSDSLAPDERETVAAGLTELESYVAALGALPATSLSLDDGGLRRAGWEAKAAPLPNDVREFMVSHEVFRDPIDFIAHIAALDGAL